MIKLRLANFLFEHGVHFLVKLTGNQVITFNVTHVV